MIKPGFKRKPSIQALFPTAGRRRRALFLAVLGPRRHGIARRWGGGGMPAACGAVLRAGHRHRPDPLPRAADPPAGLQVRKCALFSTEGTLCLSRLGSDGEPGCRSLPCLSFTALLFKLKVENNNM